MKNKNNKEEDPIIEDKHAYELLKHLGYDLDYYDKRKQNPSQVGCCLRAKWIDDETLKFTEQNRPCQVIQLGAGIELVLPLVLQDIPVSI